MAARRAWQPRSFPVSASWVPASSFARDCKSRASTRRPTLWCSAAVGLLAGSGHPLHAALAASFVILVNLLLRPLVRLINRAPIAQAETDFHYKVRAVCRSPEEAHIRALLLQGTSGGQLSLRQLDSNDIERTGHVEVNAHLTAHAQSDAVLEQVVGRLSLEPTVSAASWQVESLME
jgi:putative Mg2+ transporter-C (MgtC) family protein